MPHSILEMELETENYGEAVPTTTQQTGQARIHTPV